MRLLAALSCIIRIHSATEKTPEKVSFVLRSVAASSCDIRIHSPLLFPRRPEMVVFGLNMRYFLDLFYFDKGYHLYISDAIYQFG